MRIYEIINEGEVVQFPGGEPAPEPKQISMLQAFGSEGMNLIKEVLPSKSFIEKPSYFEDIVNSEKGSISEFEFERIKKAFGQVGLPLNEYPFAEIYNLAPASMPKHPMADVPNMPEEKTFILISPAGEKRFLVDRTGAQSYIRMWMYISS